MDHILLQHFVRSHSTFMIMEFMLTCAITMARNNTGLPDGLFKGLNSLMYLSLNLCAYQNLPNMEDLTALLLFYGAG